MDFQPPKSLKIMKKRNSKFIDIFFRDCNKLCHIYCYYFFYISIAKQITIYFCVSWEAKFNDKSFIFINFAFFMNSFASKACLDLFLLGFYSESLQICLERKISLSRLLLFGLLTVLVFNKLVRACKCSKKSA